MIIKRIHELSTRILNSQEAIIKIDKLAKKLVYEMGDLNLKLSVEMPTHHKERPPDEDLFSDASQIIFSAYKLMNSSCGTSPITPQYCAPNKIGFEQEGIPHELALCVLSAILDFYNKEVDKLQNELDELISEKFFYPNE